MGPRKGAPTVLQHILEELNDAQECKGNLWKLQKKKNALSDQ